jgi:hypothetical protein
MVNSSQGGFFELLSGSSSFLSFGSFIKHSLNRDEKRFPKRAPAIMETGLFGKRTLKQIGSDFPLARGFPGTSAFRRVGMSRYARSTAYCMKQLGLVG